MSDRDTPAFAEAVAPPERKNVANIGSYLAPVVIAERNLLVKVDAETCLPLTLNEGNTVEARSYPA